MTPSLLVEILVIVVTTAGIWVGSGWLEEASEKLGAYYELPPVVRGGIIAATGSSFPELASVVFAAIAGSFGLGVGAIVGSAIFNVLVIPALAVIVPGTHIKATRTLVHKETLFYLLAILVLFLTFAFALIYYPLGDTSEGELTRWLVLFPLGTYGLYLFLQWQDTTDYTQEVTPAKISPRRQWILLLAGLLVLLVAVERLVHAVVIIGDATGTSDFLWGVTIVAAATSIPDALVSIQAAGKDRDVASIANVVGSNIFDLLVVIPVGVLLTGTAVVDFAITAPMMGVLVLATMLLFVTLRTGLALRRWEAFVLLIAYLAFVAWVLAEALALVNVLPS